MKTFGTLEYAIDKYSGSWTWKITGVRAVMMISKLIPELWYGNGPNEVIVPDITFVATANAVLLTGATPVLVDVNNEDMNISIDSIKKSITSKTKAIMPVHWTGRICNMEKIISIAINF